MAGPFGGPRAAAPVAPGVWRLPLRYAVEVELGTVLVDAGNPGDGGRILAMLRAAGVPPPPLVLLTHGDVDHAGGVPDLIRVCAPDVRASAAEASVLAGGGGPRLLRRLGRLPTGRLSCTGSLEDGRLAVGLGVVATPGHTPGHCSFLREADGVPFAGDALSVRGAAERIPRRPFTEDRTRAYASLARLAELRPRLLLPGHGEPLPDPAGALRAAREAAAAGLPTRPAK